MRDFPAHSGGNFGAASEAAFFMTRRRIEIPQYCGNGRRNPSYPKASPIKWRYSPPRSAGVRPSTARQTSSDSMHR